MDNFFKAVIFITGKLVLFSKWVLAPCLSLVYPQFFKFQPKKRVVTRCVLGLLCACLYIITTT